MSISLENAEHYIWGNNCEAWHLLKSDTLNVIQERMPPGSTEQLHWHGISQQMFFILSGTATFDKNGQREGISAGEALHIPPKVLHRVSNLQEEDLSFLVISDPDAHADRIEILNYSAEYKDHVRKLNYEWLQRYFAIEPHDTVQLNDPQREIIDNGGLIFFARQNNEIVGSVALMYVGNGVYELGKMAVTEKAQGRGIGTALLQHCLNVAKRESIQKLVLYSNSKLEAAVHLYRKYGFREIDLEPGRYRRANIKMEKII